MPNEEERLQELEKDFAQFIGKNDAYWEHQHRWTTEHDVEDRILHSKVDRDLAALEKRVTVLEKTVAKWAAIAAATGALLGALVPQFIDSIIK